MSLTAKKYRVLSDSGMISRILKTIKRRVEVTFRSSNASIVVGANTYVVSRIYNNELFLFARNHERYEPELNVLFKTIFGLKSGAFVDIGANIGQTFLKVLALDGKRQYIGFEPQLHGCFLLDDFITKNRLSNSVVLPVALSDKSKIAQLGINEPNDAAASFVQEYRPKGFYSQYKSIITACGDEMLNSLDVSSVAMLKIDAEGAELEIIRGLSSTIMHHKPLISFEVLPHFLFYTRQELDSQTKKVRNRRHDEIDKELRRHGYRIFQIQHESGIKEVMSINAAKRDKYDYIAVPASDTEEFTKQYRENIGAARESR